MIRYTLGAALLLAGVLGMVVGKIWAIISFLTFLFKDYDFNWISVWLIGIGMLLFAAGAVMSEPKRKW